MSEKTAAKAAAAIPSPLGSSLSRQILRYSPSWFVSMMVHAVALLVLAFWVAVPAQEPTGPAVLDLYAEDQLDRIDQLAALQPEALGAKVELESLESLQPPQKALSLDQPAELVAEELESIVLPVTPEPLDHGFAPKGELLRLAGGQQGALLAGRNPVARGELVRRGGGTQASEDAVAAALRWLDEHQNPDGSWSFEHHRGPCQGRCDHPGTLANGRSGATALALLPFLGAGHTHQQGDYQKTIDAGLRYLGRAMKVSEHGGDLRDGGMMYSHGIAAIALCEAYAMTRDERLIEPAQATINFIVFAQDPRGGGWRYAPHQAGDTSVVGWQIMALKSAYMAYLQVPPVTIKKASQFLDSVQSDRGAAYGYTSPGDGSGTTAVGLLARMHLGWKKEHPSLKRGVEQLALLGPSPVDFYYNYYAMQVLFQYTGGQGPVWKQWNDKLREQLVACQNKKGHARGSWFVPGDSSSTRGGRLYCTAMAAMTLEVYYRHMPIYGEDAIKAFPE